MDATKEKSQLDDLLASFKNYNVNNTSAVTGAIGPLEIDGTMVGSGGYSTDTITLSPTWTTTSSNITVSSIPNITIANGGYSASAFGNVWGGSTLGVPQAGQLNLQGEEADIKINGKSLMKVIESLEQRLNILTPNKELEADWDELRELGERYRALEKQCEEKAAMWKKLKSMPAPDIT